MTPEEYADLVEKTYSLVIAEIESARKLSEDDRQAVYPKLIVMYEFFRCLRGEAFNDTRPHPTPEGKQETFYKHEHFIRLRLDEVKHMTNVNSERTKYHLDQLLKDHFVIDEKKQKMAEYNKQLASKPQYPSSRDEFLEYYQKSVTEGKPFMLHGLVDDPNISSIHGTQSVRITRLNDGELRLGHSLITTTDFKKAPYMVDEEAFVAEMKRLGATEEMINEVVASSNPGYERDLSNE